MTAKNLFEDIPVEIEEELFEEIVSSPNVKIERIISEGHASSEGFWYDQKLNELVFLLKGSAELEFENQVVQLKEGDYLNIPARTKHRVTKTSKNPKAIWLAVHY